MKLHKKIDFYFLGDYLASTNQSKTCKEAKEKFLHLATTSRSHLERYISKHPKHLKVRFLTGSIGDLYMEIKT